MANETTYTYARAHLATLCNDVASTGVPVIIHRRKAEDVALISAAELRSLEETAHLLRSPKNAHRLLRALARVRRGKARPQSVEQLRKSVGLPAGR